MPTPTSAAASTTRDFGFEKMGFGFEERESKPKNQSEREEKQDGERVEKSDIEERERINQIKKHIQ